jgi:hypothetical protein
MDVISSEEDWWWIDFLENELDPMLDKDLQMLLENSSEDRQSFETFRLLKQWLSESDPIKGWPVEDRLPRMRARVMSVVEREIKRPSAAAPGPRRDSEAELR